MPRNLALSVVVSVRDSSATIEQVLMAIRASDLSPDTYEIIVVDDASTDESVAIAARQADTVVRLNGRPAGPAYARNRGAELAKGEFIAFVDGDVSVDSGTLRTMLEILACRPDVDAVSASQNPAQGADNFVSRYWNLLVSFGEDRHRAPCAHFASGCGVVRRSALTSAGMYDEWRFSTRCLENLELGERLARSGRGVLLSSDVTVAHLKEWSFASICREVWGRSILLARSLGYQRMSSRFPGEVVFTLSRALLPALVIVGTLPLTAAFLPGAFVVEQGGIAMLALLVTNLPLHRFYARQMGLGFALLSAPLHVVVQAVAAAALCAGWILRDVFGDVLPDATTQAYSEVGLETWPPVPRRP